MLENNCVRSTASFRDPDGFVFQHQNEWYRYVSSEYRENYEHLIESGLYERLINDHLLIPHQEVSLEAKIDWQKSPYKILKPNRIHTITYPYEWSFSQLKEAAIATLKIQKIALDYGMNLKDASMFNIQLFKGRPVLIDTLSFIKSEPNQPWFAMGQFYRHFFWPLLAMACCDVNLNKLLLLHIDGFKYETIQPWFGIRTWFKPKTLLHVHLHGLISKFSSQNNNAPKKNIQINQNSLKIILESLLGQISKLDVKQSTVWKEYYSNTNYQTEAFQIKEKIVSQYIVENQGADFIDFGANNGHFSLLAKNYASKVFALDFDPMAVDTLYRKLDVASKDKIIPLIVDLTNPTPTIGWNNQERLGLLKRLPKNAAGLVLALIHHLHITYNIDFEMQAAFFNQYCNKLLIEFITINDSQVIKLLNNRFDLPPNYSSEHFESSFSRYFDIIEKHAISETNRVLYSMKRKQ